MGSAERVSPAKGSGQKYQSSPFQSAALRPSKISAGGRRSARLSLSGWVMSIPYPFLPQMAKGEPKETV